jgi:hypothetical protein
VIQSGLTSRHLELKIADKLALPVCMSHCGEDVQGRLTCPHVELGIGGERALPASVQTCVNKVLDFSSSPQHHSMKKHCPQQQLSPPQKGQVGKAMTRSKEELSRDEHIDQRVLVEHIKNDLFPKAKFVLGEDEWDVGGMIYKDCIKCCRGRIGLQTMTEVERERHMETIWMRALNKKVQKKALVQKRSVVCTVLQNKFTGMSCNRGAVLEKEKLFLTRCCSYKRHVSTLCGSQVCFALNRESEEKMERSQGLLHFLHEFLHCCGRRDTLEGTSLKRRRADWQQHHGGIRPAGFGKQLQGVALQGKQDTSKQ